MAYVEKRQQRRQDGTLGPVRWRVRYKDSTGKLVSYRTTFDKKGDAERYAASVETDKARGRFVNPRLGQLHFDEWVEQSWAATTNLRPSTRARDASYLKTHILPVFGPVPLSEITQLHVRQWVAKLSTTHAPATVAKAYQILAKTMAAAVDAGLIVDTPCRRIALPKVEREEMRFLRPEEVHRLAEAIHPRYHALVLLGAYGGLRIGELAGLRRSRVNLLAGTVAVAEILVEVDGRLIFGKPKTRAGRRSVGLPRAVVDELQAHLEQHAGEDLVFVGPAGGPLRVPAWRQRFWYPAVRDAGLEPLRPHDLRHTAVAMWIAAGANPLEVARRAGHTSTSFTQDRYGHLYEESDLELRDRLDAMFDTGATAPAGVVVRLPSARRG